MDALRERAMILTGQLMGLGVVAPKTFSEWQGCVRSMEKFLAERTDA